MATSKPDIMIILLSKLMEEGDMFYKVREARGQLSPTSAITADYFLHIESTRICTILLLVLEAKDYSISQ